MRAVIVTGIAAVAAVVGFYAGFIALLAVTGLDAPRAVPVAGLAGAGVLVGLVAGVGWRRRPAVVAALAASTMLVGAILGGLLTWLDLDLEWVIPGGLALVAGAVTAAARELPTRRGRASMAGAGIESKE